MNAAYTAFREPSLLSDPVRAAIRGDFSDWDSRRLRYAIYWAYYENTAFEDIHAWAKLYKVEAALYEYIRNIKNPAYQLGEFWKAHLWGGMLDTEAGDGTDPDFPTCLPIITTNAAIRPAIAQIWRWSNFQILKDLVTLWGTIFGDTFIVVADDTIKRKVALRSIHPGTVKEFEKDAYGNIKSYTIVEERQDPDATTEKMVDYVETAKRDGDNIIYETYKDKNLYAWPGQEMMDENGRVRLVATWTQPYGFVPMVHVQHNNVGLDWGWSEIHPLRSRIQEIDDLASNLSDQIRKLVHPFTLFAGVTAPTAPPEAQRPSQSTTEQLNRPKLGREAINALYTPNENAKAIPVVAELDIPAVVAYINSILDDIRQNCPELMNLFETGNDPSGRAIRITRQPVETKVKQRRANYDDALMRVHQMAISIGGYRGYEAFKGFDLDSYDAGALDHHIGDRPIFPPDPIDQSEESKSFWAAAELATKAGMPVDAYLQTTGDPRQLAALKASEEYQLKVKGMKRALEAPQVQPGDNPNNQDEQKQEDNQDDIDN